MFGKRQAKPDKEFAARQPETVPATAAPEPVAEPAESAPLSAEPDDQPLPESLDADALAEAAAAEEDFGFDDSELFADLDDSFDLDEDLTREIEPVEIEPVEFAEHDIETTPELKAKTDESTPAAAKSKPKSKPEPEPQKSVAESIASSRDDSLEEAKVGIFGALIESIDLTELSKLDPATMRTEIGDIIGEIISVKNLVLSATEQQTLVNDIINDILGLGPLEPLLERDDIADIMVNTFARTYIEVDGQMILSNVRFRDNAQLMNICTRIVSAVGRRVDEANPICDARLADGSRVNVIVPPLAIDGPILTIRKFKKDTITLDRLVEWGSMSPKAAKVLEIASACRLNILISGGTGSGKTTLLNCLSRQIGEGERVITVEDAAELQLQQDHVVRLETRPPNLEGKGEITQTDLVKNCLRMRPERIILGEIRGAEAMDMLQAMNTGHDGSMGTVHANNPREALTRLENMISMGGFELPLKNMRTQISSAINMVVQASRLRDGSRKVTHISEIVGMEGEVVTIQDLYTFEYEGEDEDGKIVGYHKSSGLRPNFYEKARYYGREQELMAAIE
jgi:pilus assembly protein CpaF